MTEEIYSSRIAHRKNELYKQLPIEFVSYIESTAYDRGHSYGEAETDSIAVEIALNLLPVINNYTARILSK